MSKTEREICTFEIDLKICFVCALINLSDANIIFYLEARSENGYGF